MSEEHKSGFRALLCALSLFGLPVDPSISDEMQAPRWLKIILALLTIIVIAFVVAGVTRTPF